MPSARASVAPIPFSAPGATASAARFRWACTPRPPPRPAATADCPGGPPPRVVIDRVGAPGGRPVLRLWAAPSGTRRRHGGTSARVPARAAAAAIPPGSRAPACGARPHPAPAPHNCVLSSSSRCRKDASSRCDQVMQDLPADRLRRPASRGVPGHSGPGASSSGCPWRRSPYPWARAGPSNSRATSGTPPPTRNRLSVGMARAPW